MKIVVTGGAGFIGSNVVRALAGSSRVSEIVVVDDLSTGSLDNLAGVPAHLVKGTILDADLLDDVFDEAASVIHLAAIPSVSRSIDDPVANHETNATGTVLVLEAARRNRVAQIVLASSAAVYGDSPERRKHEWLCPMPRSPYAVSKLASE